MKKNLNLIVFVSAAVIFLLLIYYQNKQIKYLTNEISSMRWELSDINRHSRNIEGSISELNRTAYKEYYKEYEDDEMLTPTELADYLKISIEDVYSYSEYIPHIKINGEYRFSKKAIDEWSMKTVEISNENQGTKKEIIWNKNLNPGELSRYLYVTINEIMDWVRDENSGIPFTEKNGFIRFNKSEIDEWWKEFSNKK